MAIKYVDIEPENGKAAKRDAAGAPGGATAAGMAPARSGGVVAAESPKPEPAAEKPKRKRR